MLRIFSLFLSVILTSSIQDTVFFKSANPFSFKDVIKNLEDQKEYEVYGILSLPSNINKNDKIPLIIGVAVASKNRGHPVNLQLTSIMDN